MAIPTEISKVIKSLPKSELEKLVIKSASKDKIFRNYLLVNYVDKESGEKDLYEDTKTGLLELMTKNYRGFSEELRMANMLAACSKRITEFSKNCKDKTLEADLILFVLEVPFTLNSFRTCFTALNHKTVLLLKRLINLVQNKMHEDYRMEYRGKMNQYLATLHKTSNHLDYVYALPQYID